MGRRVQVRAVTNEERQAVTCLAHARAAPARTACAPGHQVVHAPAWEARTGAWAVMPAPALAPPAS